MQQIIRRLALENAVKYNGVANPKALVGALIKVYPEAKKNMHETMQIIAADVELVNAMNLQDQKSALLKINPNHFTDAQEKKSRRKEQHSVLPSLENAIQGKVVTRMPPEPSKYPHLGHALSFIINYLYAKMYGGKCILRFDDTNPEKSSQEFVDAITDDIITYLEAKPDQIIIASDHMDQYYGFAQTLIDKGLAYTCSCPQETMSKLRRDMSECEHRTNTQEVNQADWDSMKSGSATGTVLRLKIDMSHKNAVMRDPAIYRVSGASHYKTGTQFKAWPLYDFESAVEEGLNKVTHVMRGNEFASRIELQQYIHKILNLPTAVYKQYGRFNVTGAITQGREIRAGIENGNFTGWDDPRLVTLRALKRRGIVKESYYELAVQVGMSKSQTNIDYSLIASINRKILDASAKRFFLIEDPIKITIKNIPDSITEFALAYHPEHDKGQRILARSDSFLLEKKDVSAIKEGVIFRLMDAINVERKDNNFYFVSESYDEYRSALNKGPIIHFLPIGSERSACVVMDDASVKDVLVESNVSVLKEGDVIQFERWGFARLDAKEEKPVFYFTHY